MTTHLSITRRALLGSAAVVALLPAVLFAADIRSGEQAGTASGETIARNAYLAGGAVVSSGSIGGDLAAAGGTIVVNGPVGADVEAAGGNISILGSVKDDVRIAGGTLVVAGSVGGDLVAAGGQITATAPRIGGDALLAGGTVRLTSAVSGSVRIRGGSVVIDAPIAGNVEVHAQSLTLGSHAVITGDLTYEAPKAATMETGSSVKGKTTFTPVVDVSVGPAAALALFSVWILASLAALLVSAFIMRALFRRYIVEVAAAVVARPWHKLGIGFVSLVVTPAAAMVMFLTVVGIPLGVLTMLAYVALVLVSWMFTPIVLGAFIEKWWHKRTPQMNWQVVLYGAIVYVLIGLLPIIGPLFKFAILLIALGAIVEKKWEIASEWV
jgi:hypothetical protein